MIYEPNRFIDMLLAKSAASFEEAEVYYESGSALEVQILKGEVSLFESSTTQGLSFRGRKNGQMGYAFTEAFTDEAIDFLLTAAEQNCAVLELEEAETLYKGDDNYQTVKVYEPKLEQLVFEDFSKRGIELERLILESDPRIVAVDHCFVSMGSSTTRIKNSLGLDLAHESNMFFIYADARAEEKDQVKTGSGFWFGRDLEQLNIKKLAADICQDTLSKLGATSVPSDKYTIVLGNEAAADLLGCFCGIFSADVIQKGLSLLGDKMNTLMAADCVTIRDDASTPLSITSIPFDSEGLATANKVLIDNGKLVQVLHNRKTAAKGNTQSTGNGFRGGYKGSLSVGPTNFYIQPKSQSFDELLTAAENGIYIKEIAGLHAGANTVSGDFSLSAEGFLIEDGKLTRAVDQITVAENFYTLLQKVLAVGSDLYFSPPSESGSIGAPSLLLSDIAVSGE